MSPALEPGQEVLGIEVGVGGPGPARGSVVFFEQPGRAGFWLVKRVVGLPGERVTIAGGAVFLDGAEYDDPWTFDDTAPGGEWVVGPGEMFVLSDARHRSTADSRSFGPVPVAGSYRLSDGPDDGPDGRPDAQPG